MKYENVKSLVLFLLVAASGALTWTLWTYQPKYDVFPDKYHEVSISNQQEPMNLIKPARILYHVDGVHYGTVDDNLINDLLLDMSQWSLFDIGEAKSLNDAQIQELSHADNRVTISFPDLVPFDLYKSVLHFETKVLPADTFDRIVVNLASGNKEDASVFFLSTETRRVYESHINAEALNTFVREIEGSLNQYSNYKAYVLPDERTMYLPSDTVSVTKYKFYSDYIDPVKFQNALFKDPSKVRRDILADGEKFTDFLSMMNVDYNTNMIFYVNPGQDQEERHMETPGSLLRRSITFVNEHSGWTDNYQYFGLDADKGKTVFRLFMDGYPVFNDQGMAQIEQIWGITEIYQYSRPYFSLDIALPGQTEVELPSGEDALNYALNYMKINDPEFKPELLEDMMIGYKLSKDPDSQKVFVLEPSWYYRYAGSWLRMSPEEIKEGYRGLE
ncbi:MAG TPA: two-component system activity regulator YycH [Bacillaceae bacterium]